MKLRGCCVSALCMCIWFATSTQVGYAQTKGVAAKKSAQRADNAKVVATKTTKSAARADQTDEGTAGELGSPRGTDGACCDDFTGGCSIQPTMEFCNLVGGTWQGAGTGCTPNPCNQPLDCFSLSPSGTLISIPPEPIVDIDLSPSDEGNNNVATEFFILFQYAYVTDIRWWGVYQGATQCAPASSDFRIRIYGDAAGPGAGPTMPSPRVLCENVVTVEPLHTGQNVGGREIREFSASIPQCAVPNTAWIEIQKVDDGSNCIFNWVSGDNPGSFDGNTSLLNGQQVNWDLSICMATDTPGVPTGACCDDDTGGCTENELYSNCVGTSNRFTADTACMDVDPPCGQVTGACCATFSDGGGAFEEGDCAIATASDCALMFGGGGSWSGAFTDCTPNPCQGACCLSDGMCMEATVNECAGLGGQHFGNGTTCNTTACPGTGRCCFNLGAGCEVVTEDACISQFGGVWTADISCQVACPIPPSNDECSSALDIPCGGNLTVDNTTATENATDPLFSCHFGGADTGFGTIWFTFTADDTSAIVSTCNSEVGDTLLAVYDGTCGSLTEIACSEDDCGLLSTLCAENLVVGNTYYIQAATFGDGGRGAITVEVNCPCPSGACCTDAGCTVETPQTCDSLAGTYIGDNTICDATTCNGACCFADGTCMDLSSGDCSAQGGFFEAVGTFCIDTVCPIRPTNESCDIPIVLDPSTDLPYSEILGFGFATADGPPGSCDQVGGATLMQNDLWWEITPTENCQLRVTVTPTGFFDPIVVVRDSCVPGNELACSDETGGGEVEQLELVLTAGNTYFIQIGDTGGFGGGEDATVDIICGQVGSCCLPDNRCVVNQDTDCAALGGTFGGPDTDCGFLGGCCLPGTCVVTSNECCVSAGGSYVGDGTNCGDVAGMPTTYDSGPVGLAINDNATTTSDQNLADTGTIADLNLSIDITHTFIGDLTVDLTHSGITVRVMDRDCGGNDDIQATFDDEAMDVIQCATPTIGTFIPSEPLSAFDGGDRSGLWTLSVTDNAGADQGTLNSWQLVIDGVGVSPCDAGTGACCVDTQTCTPDQTVAQCSAAGGTFLGVDSTCSSGACDIRGACCDSITGGCTVESEANCNTHGVYQGDFSNCETVSCPIILGACCNADASCTSDLTFDACTSAGGSWQGSGTVCSSITGACCFPGAECRSTTQECCEAAGGLFQGAGISCGGESDSGPVNLPIDDLATTMSTITVAGSGILSDVNVSLDITHTWIGDLDISLEHNGVTVAILSDPCGNFDDLLITLDDSGGPLDCNDTTSGAAVIPDNPLSAFNGLDKQGNWNLSVFDDTGGDTGTLNSWKLIVQSDGDLNPCQGGTGACCVDESTCMDNQSIEDCDAANGLYLGIGSTCSAGVCAITGACCNPVTGVCTEESQLSCESVGSLYQGNFTTCATAECTEVPGACCNADGSCQNDLTFNECTGNGGSWQGASTTCPTITGACCLTGGLCLVTSQDCCLNAGGAYVGDGTNCGASAGAPMTYIGPFSGAALDDVQPPAVSTINVPDTFTVGDVNVHIDLTHTFVGDLCATLEHNGTVVELIQRSGADNGSGTCHMGSPFGCGSDNYDIVLDDEGTGGNIEDFCDASGVNPPSPPNFMPFEPLTAFDGMSANGDWTLTVTDNAGGDTGTFNSFDLIIDGVGVSPCDMGTGACCLSTTNCVPDQTLQQCSDSGGTFLGLGSTCTPGVCDLMGACCDNITGACTVESEANCNTHGTYHGDFSSCATVTCPTILGACCNPDATCTPDVTFNTCEDPGGSWQGPDSVCNAIVGACCLPGGTNCLVTSQDCCAAAGGGYVGDGTNCGEAAGNPTTYDSGLLGFAIDDNTTTTADLTVSDSGTIGDVNVTVNITHTFLGDLVVDLIHNGVTVTVMDRECGGNDNMMATFDDEATDPIMCATPTTGTFTPANPLSAFDGMDRNGVWTLSVADNAGGDTGTLDSFQLAIDGVGQNPCDNNPGACCLPNETCVEDQTPIDCAGMNGTYQGAGTACANVDCTIRGACCNVTDGSCRMVEDGADCNLPGEVYQGDNTDCATTTCPVQRGACCLPDGTCANDLTVGECETDNGGSWQGDGTTCSTNTGACCLPTSCIVTTETCCGAAGGTYEGDDTPCGTAAGNPTPYSSSPGTPIPDEGQVDDVITVGDSFTIGDVDVQLDITHTWVGDLTVTLEHVSTGTTATLVMRPAADANLTCPDHNLHVTLDDEGTGGGVDDQCVGDFVSDYPTSPPSFTPVEPLSAFDGLNAASDWRLTVADGQAGDTGMIDSWTIFIDGIGQSACDMTGCQCPGDVNGDGSVDGADVQPFAACLLSGTGTCECADMNGSSSVTMSDLPLFVNALLNSSGPCGGGGDLCTTCQGDANGDGIIDSRDLDAYIDCLINGGSCPCTEGLTMSEMVDLVLNSTGLCP